MQRNPRVLSSLLAMSLALSSVAPAFAAEGSTTITPLADNVLTISVPLENAEASEVGGEKLLHEGGVYWQRRRALHPHRARDNGTRSKRKCYLGGYVAKQPRLHGNSR